MEISAAIADAFAEQLVELTGNTCYFCGCAVDRRQLRSVDFIVPLSKGGAMTVDNAILCCKDCSARRRRRHMADYVSARLSELRLELERLKALEQALLVKKLAPAARHAAKELASKPKVVAPPKATVPEPDAAPLFLREDGTFDDDAYNAWLDKDD